MSRAFQALLLDQAEGKTVASLQTLTPDRLPEGEVTVQVAYSSLNYKDGLAVTGKGRIIRKFPAIPGIDLAGTVIESASPDFRPGDQVIGVGWGLGERYWGGFTQVARVRADCLEHLPTGLTLRQAMAVGTAGLAAALCVLALEHHGIKPGGEVVVTGASGGVGSVAVALLAQRGFRVAAATGRAELHEYLTSLGAAELVGREVLATDSGRPMESERWAGGVDTVGGQTLATVIKQVGYGGAVAAVGLAGGTDLNTTVFPFILRGVSLLGVDSVMCPRERRAAVWKEMAAMGPGWLEAITSTITLADLPEWSERIVAGQVRGRVVVDLNG